MEEKIKELPESVGVYIFKGEGGRPLYVGKALSIKRRVQTHFAQSHTNNRWAKILEKVKDIEYVLCKNEKEALLLEASFIKEQKPPFNIRLKDDKAYPWVLITEEEFPRLCITKKRKEKGKYIGPFTESTTLRKILRIVREFFPLRTCKKMKKRPCLNFYMRKCIAPCTKKVEKEDYLKNVQMASLFLSGSFKDALNILEERMKECAEKLQFEEAAKLRDTIKHIQRIVSKQRVVGKEDEECDVIGCKCTRRKSAIFLICVREGRIVEHKKFFFSSPSLEGEEEVINSFLKQYYIEQEDAPSKIFISSKVSDKEILEEVFRERFKKKVEIITPKSGRGKELLSFAQENASLMVKEVSDPLFQFQKLFKLPSIPYRIEAFDVSNICQKEATGSLVVFEEGKPKKDEYRRFKIKGEKTNDVAMLKEVLLRHYKRVKEEGGKLPDLLIVDGGKAQLNAAISVMLQLGFDAIPILAFPKGEEEKVFLKGRRQCIYLKNHQEALLLLSSIRSEAHRFAIKYHRVLRRKAWR